MSRLHPASAILMAFLALAPLARAQSEAPPVDCAKAMVQSDLNACAYQDYEAADKELNAVYRVAMTAMQKTDQELGALNRNYVGAVEALKKAQRAWITYRDGQCELAGFAARGGSMEPMLVSGCLMELTNTRTEELKSVIEGMGN